MKKFLAVLALLVLVLLFGVSTKTADASSPDTWLGQDAKVSEEVYALLQDRAGFASYIYTGENIPMNPENLSTFIIEEKFEDYFIGKFSSGSNSNKILVTKDGLIVSYVPKEFAHTMFADDVHFKDVQATVKIFVGPTIEQANYINFASLGSNKATIYYNGYDANLVIPATAKINNIGYSYVSGRDFYPGYYGTIVPGSLQPGETHSVSHQGRYIDGILVFTKSADSMNIFYTSNTPITVQGTSNYSTYNLNNKFVVGDSVTPPDTSLVGIQIQPMSTIMTLGELQSISLVAQYKDGSSQTINASEIDWTSTSPNVADFTSGKLLAITPGTTTLIARYGGYIATVNVQVQAKDYKELPKKFNIAANKRWKVNFSAPVDIQSVTEENIYVTDSNGFKVPIRYNFINNQTIQLVPSQNYVSGKTYTVWVKGVQSIAGKTLKKNTKMDFAIK